MPSELTENVIAEFRTNGGRVGGDLADTPIILVHHIGAKTRTARVTPLAYSAQPDGRLVIAGSNGGSPRHPAWYHNLKAHPTIVVEQGTHTFTALAEELTGAARAALWSELVAAAPALGEFQAKTARRIPLFTLSPIQPGCDLRAASTMLANRAESPPVVGFCRAGHFSYREVRSLRPSCPAQAAGGRAGGPRGDP